MKVTIDRDALHDALSRARKVVSVKRGTIPIWETYRVEAAAERLELRGNDGDMDYRDSLPSGLTETAGAICADAARLASIAATAPEGSDLSLTLEESTLRVQAGRARFSLSTLPTEGFPGFKEPEGEPAEIGPELVTALLRCLEAASTDETRQYLCGVYLHKKDDQLVTVATDGHRLMRVTMDLPDGLVVPEGGIIVPRRTVVALGAAFSDGAISFLATDDCLVVERDARRLQSRLIDGTFPYYECVIPTAALTASVNSAALKAAVNQVLGFIGHTKMNTIGLRAKDGKLTLMGSAEMSERATVEIDIESEQDWEIGFNGRYVLSMLEAVKSGSVQIDLTDGVSPAIFSDPDKTDFTAVLMPLRVNFSELDRAA